MTDNQKAQVVLRADDSPMRQSLREMLGKFREFGEGAKKSVGGVSDSMGSLRSMLLGVTAALSGGAVIAFLKQTAQLQDEMSKAAQKAGVTTEQFSGMNYAAKLADVSTEQLTKTYAKLGAALTDAQAGQKEAVELFRRLKLDPKNIKDADELLLSLAERFESMPDGARKTGLAIDTLGERLGPGLIPFLNQGRLGIQALREEAQRLGLVISTEQGKQAEEFNDNLTKLGGAARGAGNEILKGLLPSLTAASNYFVKVTKEAGLFQGTLISIGALMARGLGIDDIGQAESRLKTLRKAAAEVEKNLADMNQSLALHPGNATFTGVADKLKVRLELIRAEILKTSAELARMASDAPNAGAGRGFVNPPNVKGTGFDPEDKKSDTEKAKALPDGAASYMPYYEGLLAEEKRAFAILNAGREYTKEQELAYWRWLSDNLQFTSADKLAVLRKTAGLELDIARRTAQERAQIDADGAATAEKFALGRVEAEAAAARAAQDLGAISKAQLAGLEVQFEQQRYAIQASALQQRLALLELDPTTNPVEMARIKNELLLLEQQHQTQRLQLLGQQAKEEGSFGNQLAEMVGSEASWNNLFNGLIARTLTWQQAMSNIFQSVGQAFLSEFVTKAVAGQAKGLAVMLAQKLGFLTAEQAAQGASSAVIIGEKEIEATAVVAGNAAEAGSGAASAMASIPYIGPALALAAMASVFAAVMALSSTKSARGGYNIPAGVNPMTQLHEEEMVLPSSLANAVRRMAAQDADAEAGAGASRAAAGAPVHIHGRPDDKITMHELAKLLKQMKRNFVLVG